MKIIKTKLNKISQNKDFSSAAEGRDPSSGGRYPMTQEMKNILLHEINYIITNIELASSRFIHLKEASEETPEWWSEWQDHYQQTGRGMKEPKEWVRPEWSDTGEMVVKNQIEDLLENIKYSINRLKSDLETVRTEKL